MISIEITYQNIINILFMGVSSLLLFIFEVYFLSTRYIAFNFMYFIIKQRDEPEQFWIQWKHLKLLAYHFAQYYHTSLSTRQALKAVRPRDCVSVMIVSSLVIFFFFSNLSFIVLRIIPHAQLPYIIAQSETFIYYLIVHIKSLNMYYYK